MKIKCLVSPSLKAFYYFSGECNLLVVSSRRFHLVLGSLPCLSDKLFDRQHFKLFTFIDLDFHHHGYHPLRIVGNVEVHPLFSSRYKSKGVEGVKTPTGKVPLFATKGVKAKIVTSCDNAFVTNILLAPKHPD